MYITDRVHFVLGDTVYFVGVKSRPTNIKEGPFAGLSLPGLAVLSGTVVAINEDDTLSVDVPNGYNTPWKKQRNEVFLLEADATEELKRRLEKMRIF